MVSRTVGVTTCTSPIFQRTGLNFPRLNATYYSQIKGNDTTKISFRPSMYLNTVNKSSKSINLCNNNFRTE